MLNSVNIARRQSEIRQSLAELGGKPDLTEEETRNMDALDREYQVNETRYRAALITEDGERQEAAVELETRSDREWSEVAAGFELRQAMLTLDEGRPLTGKTAEAVEELRGKGGYRGVPVPWEALETRTGETLADGTPNPLRTAPIIERLFAESVAARMGGRMVNIGVGESEYPVATSAVTAGWAGSETGNVPGPSAYTTIDRPLKPDNTLGVHMRITRKALKQSGTGLEQAVRRDMNGAMQEAMDRAVFLGSGTAGEPTGLIPGASSYGITETDLTSAADTDSRMREIISEAVHFMTANAARGPQDLRMLVRPEFWGWFDKYIWDNTTPGGGSGVTHWDRMLSKFQSITLSPNALEAPTGSPVATTAILTTTAGGTPPFFVGTWGAIDLIRDPYSDAQSGGLRLTALATMDVTISRSVQTRIINNISLEA